MGRLLEVNIFRKKLESGLDLLNFSIINLAAIAVVFAIATGGVWIWIVIISTFLANLLCDEFFSPYLVPIKMPKWLMEVQLKLTLPFLFIITLVALNATAPTPLPFIDPFLCSLGFDTATSREQTWPLVVFFVVGFTYGSFGSIAAHELCHRSNYGSKITARWLLAFSWDSSFPIEHVYGHHKNVGTESDPSTARRGESLLKYLSRSVVGQIKGAYNIELRRLSRHGISNNILTNRFYRGQLMSLVVLVLYMTCLGWIKGMLMCFFAAAVGKLLLEITNYITHYGLVRIPGHPVESRHSWDCSKRFSCYMLINLPLHPDHHQNPMRRYYELSASQNCSPIMPLGYLGMITLALFPTMWRRLMHPLLADWDFCLASPDELQYLERKGLRYGT